MKEEIMSNEMHSRKQLLRQMSNSAFAFIKAVERDEGEGSSHKALYDLMRLIEQYREIVDLR
jgi:hypothetical protein